MGDVGGLIGILNSIFEILLGSITTFYFNLYVFKHLYRVKTKD